MSCCITGTTTVAELLAGWPELEARVLELAPALNKLSNPALRDAVLSSTTLQDLAGIAGIAPGDVVARLQTAAGLEGSDTLIEGMPEWAARGIVRFSIDADEMLGRGVHPVNDVRQGTASLQPGEILELRSGFRPQPLLEMMSRSGCEVWCGEEAPGRYLTRMRRAG